MTPIVITPPTAKQGGSLSPVKIVAADGATPAVQQAVAQSAAGMAVDSVAGIRIKKLSYASIAAAASYTYDVNIPCDGYLDCMGIITTTGAESDVTVDISGLGKFDSVSMKALAIMADLSAPPVRYPIRGFGFVKGGSTITITITNDHGSTASVGHIYWYIRPTQS